jgi:hypothetical protein
MRNKLALAVVLMIVAVQAAMAGTIAFKLVQNYTVGSNPVAVAVGDFNGDGKVDLAVVNAGDPTANDNGGVSVLLGNGDGTFQSATNISVGKNPGGITVGDFNGDNRPDIIVADSTGVSILLGIGDGTFQAAVSYPAPQVGSVWVRAHDLNGDNRLDLVVNGSVLLGNADGSFQAPIGYATAGSGPAAVADLDGDGRMDLAVYSNLTTGVAILLGNGDGTFRQAWVSPRLSVSAWTVDVGDFDGDGKPDLIVQGTAKGNATASGIALLLSNGDGTFSQGSAVATGGCRNSSPTVADFDGDSKLDLVFFGNDNCFPNPKNNPRLLVMGGNGDGTFQTAVNVGGSLAPLIAADLDGNKSPDVVALNNSTANTISVLLNTAGTDFSISVSAPSPSIVRPGQSATSTVSLSLLNAFDNPASITCSVQPAQAGSPTCSLNPNSVTFDASGKATAGLTVLARGSQASQSHYGRPQPFRTLWIPVVGLAFIGMGAGCKGSNERKLFTVFMGFFLLAGLILQSGCGGGAGSAKSQAYTVTVTAVSASTQHSTTVTLTVQ